MMMQADDFGSNVLSEPGILTEGEIEILDQPGSRPATMSGYLSV